MCDIAHSSGRAKRKVETSVSGTTGNGVRWVTRGRWRRNATWRGAVFPRRSDVAGVAGVAGVYGSGGCGPVVSWVKRMGNWAWRMSGKGLEKAGRIAGLKGAFHTDGWVQLGKVFLATS